jgi:carboxymethylenebutenolidase
MCFDFDSSPPFVPADRIHWEMAGGAGAEIVTLESADGTEFAAGFAQCPDPVDDVGIIILPDPRGLYRFYIELAERFVTTGHHAVTIDYFGRTAGASVRDEEFDWAPHIPQTTAETIQLDISAARDHLRESADAKRFVTVGFCVGGAHSFLAGANPGLELDGVVGFYGILEPEREGFSFVPSPLRRAHQMDLPVLGLFSGIDDLIPVTDQQAFDRALTESGSPHEIVTYPDAPHSFFDRSFEEHAQASVDAWHRVLDFVERLPARTG